MSVLTYNFYHYNTVITAPMNEIHHAGIGRSIACLTKGVSAYDKTECKYNI